MSINRHNCESFFLDYHEGSLSPVAVAELLLFLEENSDLKSGFEEYEHICLKQEKISFTGKEEMKKKYSAEGIEAILASEISPDNREQFFIAFAEGQLSPKKIAELNSFLANNPKYRKEFELFNNCKLSPENIAFDEKAALKKTGITKENYEQYFIRHVERDLNRAEEEDIKLFLSNYPEYNKELKLFASSILSKDAILFDDKPSLKKRERKPVFISIFSQRTTYYAAAAAILLLVGLFFIFNNESTDKIIVAEKTRRTAKVSEAVKPENKTAIENEKRSIEKKEQTQKTQHAREKQTAKKISIEKKFTNEEQQQPTTAEDKEPSVPVAKQEQESEQQIISSENLAEKNQEKKKEDNIIPGETIASANIPRTNDEYQTIGAFARKKIRQILKIKQSTECNTDDKITVWDLAMAAKNGIQNMIGTKAVDVNKICDGKGNKIEYVFAAGNFQIAKSISKKD
ncbi:MAG TPA: hypothetical protein VII99_07120 [Bacteroidia bacterium]